MQKRNKHVSQSYSRLHRWTLELKASVAAAAVIFIPLSLELRKQGKIDFIRHLLIEN